MGHIAHDTVQFSPSFLSTFSSISVFSVLTFSNSFSFPTEAFQSFRILCLFGFLSIFTTTELSLHFPPHIVLCVPCSCLSIPTAQLSQSALPSSPGRPKHLPKGRGSNVVVADLLTAWVCEYHSPNLSWRCLKCWLQISTAGQFPLTPVSLLQSWNLHLLGLYRLKNLKYFLWDRVLSKSSIHLKCDAMGFHNPACRQTTLDKCLFIVTAEVSSAFPASLSLEIKKVKVKFKKDRPLKLFFFFLSASN